MTKKKMAAKAITIVMLLLLQVLLMNTLAMMATFTVKVVNIYEKFC